MISFQLMIFWDSLEELLYIGLTNNLRYLRFWLNMVLKLILLELMWEIDDWMRLDEEMFWYGWFLSNHLSYPSFFVQNIWELNYLPSHLLLSIVRFYFIFRMEILLSFKHHMKIKLRLQRCWWKLKLIHSWEIKMWDQFPVLSFPFHVCRVKQQEIVQEKMVILISKDSWRSMRGILRDFGKNPPSPIESRAIVQDLAHQVAQLSSLEFDEGKRDELLGLPQTIQSMKEEMDRKVGEIVGENDKLRRIDWLMSWEERKMRWRERWGRSLMIKRRPFKIWEIKLNLIQLWPTRMKKNQKKMWEEKLINSS